jgi:hypothetical protein
LHAGGAARLSLAEALSLHVAALPTESRQLLSLLALAGQPLSPQLAIEAVNLSDGHTQLDRLRSEQLVRVSFDGDGGRSVECYHDKIREQVTASLDTLRTRELALGLARALLAQPAADAELLARALDLAGMPEQAAEHAARAAELAFEKLAFARAATLYTRALADGAFDGERLQALRVGRAQALGHAGRAEAADAYLSAAEHAAKGAAPELERNAAEQYLLHGDLDRGRVLLDRALRRVGHSLPQSLPAALASIAWSRTRLRLRGLGFVARPQQDASTQRELELLRMTVHCLVRSDSLRGADFSARSVRRALDAGDAVEAARALAWELLYSSLLGASDAQIEATDALCVELCERTGDRLAASLLAFCRGVHLLMRQGLAEAALADDKRVFRSSNRGLERNSRVPRALL